ncbi:unnamed protein product, partial [marine sediment metagenome]
MGIYDPLRDSFSELNRMLIDAQQWDEKHAEMAADRNYKAVTLQSNLQQQEFQNQMAQRRLNLTERGENRADSALAQTALNQERNYKLSQEELEVTRQNADTSAAGLEIRKQAEGRAQELQASKLQKSEAEAEAIARPFEPTYINLDFIPEHVKADPAFQERLKQIVDPNEQMSPEDQQLFAPALIGLLAEFDHPMDNASSNIKVLQEQHTAQKSIATASGDNYQIADRANARRQ